MRLGGGLTPITVLLLSAAAGCNRAAAPLEARLVTGDTRKAFVEVIGLSSSELGTLQQKTPAELAAIFRVTVSSDERVAVAGRHTVTSNSVQFHPQFPFDAGRTYSVRFDPALPTRTDAPLITTVQVPAAPVSAATRVVGISPAGAFWPENTLRFYVNFSGPMSRTSSLDRIRLEEDGGGEVKEPFLPLDVDLWNGDRTRFTVFFDPGRVKRGIRPNVELGRALIAGRKYALVVDRSWSDAAGRPLQEDFRFAFTAGPAEERAITPGDWHIVAPQAGTREALVVTFPWTLDTALLQRGVGVAGPAGAPVTGDAQIDPHGRSWRFIPRESWTAGQHQLVVLALLEDPAGNRVGRPFEIEMIQKSAPAPEERVNVPFEIRPRG